MITFSEGVKASEKVLKRKGSFKWSFHSESEPPGAAEEGAHTGVCQQVWITAGCRVVTDHEVCRRGGKWRYSCNGREKGSHLSQRLLTVHDNPLLY